MTIFNSLNVERELCRTPEILLTVVPQVGTQVVPRDHLFEFWYPARFSPSKFSCQKISNQRLACNNSTILF